MLKSLLFKLSFECSSTITASDALLHGHTHRPDIHQVTADKKRYVLGDWRLLDKDTRQPKVSAVIGAVTDDQHSNDCFNSNDLSSNNTEFELYEFECLVR